MQELAINYCSTLLNVEDDNTLEVCYVMACNAFKDYTKREDIPETAISIICELMCIEYNRIGAQGLASQSYSGVSESYVDGYNDNLRKQLNRYRKLQMI